MPHGNNAASGCQDQLHSCRQAGSYISNNCRQQPFAGAFGCFLGIIGGGALGAIIPVTYAYIAGAGPCYSMNWGALHIAQEVMGPLTAAAGGLVCAAGMADEVNRRVQARSPAAEPLLAAAPVQQVMGGPLAAHAATGASKELEPPR